MAVPVLKPDREIIYPESDGKPMAETDKHRQAILYAIDALSLHFAERPDVYVSGNNFLYWEEANPKARVSPDVYVVFGAEKRLRDSYRAWEEGGALPAVVLEFTSKKTQRDDTGKKRELYERVLGVREYFLFDPTGDYLSPRLQGYRLVADRYVPIERGEDSHLHSAVLGLDLVREGEALLLFDPAAAKYLPTLQQEHERAEQAELLAERERQAREQAEARAERLAARLRELGISEDEL